MLDGWPTVGHYRWPVDMRSLKWAFAVVGPAQVVGHGSQVTGHNLCILVRLTPYGSFLTNLNLLC